MSTAPVPILVVDDEEPIRNALKRYLTKQEFLVHTASSGEEALDQLRAHEDVALMLCDIRMAGMSGVDIVPQALEISPDLAILMLTAVNDATTAALCMQRGALDYLTKPVELLELGRTIQRALKRREMMIGRRELDQHIKEEVERRTQEFQRERARLERVSVATLEVLINALEAKDPYLRGHSARVADLSASVAAHLQRPDEEIESVRTAGRLHDIGKIGIREEILNKHGPLSDEEYEHVKQHVLVGCQILAPLIHLTDVIGLVRNHHERWDGFGYPDRLAGEAIPLGARIIGAVEIYDALTTTRPYQEKMPPEEAVERMRELVGTAIDPTIHEALEAVVSRRQALVFLDDPQR